MSMFCFQCEQTAKGTGCTIGGVCGKKETTAKAQDELTGYLIALAQVAHGKTPSQHTARLMLEGLFTTVTNVSFDDSEIHALTFKIKKELVEHTHDCIRCKDKFKAESADCFDLRNIWQADEDERSLKTLVLLGLRGMSAYVFHALELGYSEEGINTFIFSALAALAEEKSQSELLDLVMETGTVNLACMALLDKANTETFGNPEPCVVPLSVEAGPFIVISGHDLHDLYLLLEQTANKGINIYTHGEMLPAHGYPKLKAFKHLRGNFGTAWQNQQIEFADIPAPVLFTTNCIMPVQKSYEDRIFTTSVVAYPGMVHIGGDRNFAQVIKKALALGGYQQKKEMTGINGGKTVTTGYGRNAVLSHAPAIVEAVKSGAIQHFFLVGGCDGAKPGRNYYTEFVKKTPKNSLVLTLACGKYRFNDLDLGKIGDFPRILDVGQCNDSYGAIQIVLALADAFKCSVNDLPLTLILSWYEQKAVAVLLTLLALGIKNIYIGPTLPAFLSPAVLKILVEKFNLTPISTPEEDLKKIKKST